LTGLHWAPIPWQDIYKPSIEETPVRGAWQQQRYYINVAHHCLMACRVALIPKLKKTNTCLNDFTKCQDQILCLAGGKLSGAGTR
jgi:hypothetical protein